MDDARQIYSDIIGLEHHVSSKRPRMSRLGRAAQFAPFAALTGYDEMIDETERETDARVELDESRKEELDRMLNYLLENRHTAGAAFTCFLPDGKKDGGEYVTFTGRIARYDRLSRSLVLDSGDVIEIDSIREIEYSEQL
ncbi:MAG: hypothetical protein IJL71_06205 [Oscillospiraceae bacterium]|nr:hypothetical protein [Oscillospiraceae bacterium]